MTQASRPLFNFDSQKDKVDETRQLICEFAEGHPFRSAQVEELELDEDFHRRPLRPEDLSFIGFRKPVRRKTVIRLPFLATQRLLLCINETGIARFPKYTDEGSLSQFNDFYGENNQILGARIRPFLEDFAFDFLSRDPGEEDITIPDLVGKIAATAMEESRFWGQLFGWLASRNYVEDGTRFILMQNWSLASSKRIALARAQASGFFEPVPVGDWPSLEGPMPDDADIQALATQCGITKREHSYWQFYLSTSMARCNLLHALARRPDRALAFYGAAFDAEAHWLAFGCLVGQACDYLQVPSVGRNIDIPTALEDLQRRFQNLLQVVETRFGAAGLQQVAQGVDVSRRLGDAARGDLRAQLHWLSSIEQFQVFANNIDDRINAECPNIDRETFVEPREMCSTTHVHSDHRLVSIESGDMVFWGNLGMQLKLKPGQRVFVPEGRLHGSTIESEECTYHQPIIPDAWIEELIGDTGIKFAA
jgi:hypothetical protein